MSPIKISQDTILQEEVELKTKIIWGESRELRFTDKNKCVSCTCAQYGVF